MCLSKALTAGMVAMSITSCTQLIFDAFLDERTSRGFFHAHTYSANPLGCAAAIAGIELLVSEEIQNDIQRIEGAHISFSEKIKTHHKVAKVRTMGVIFALELDVEMKRYGDLRNQLFQHFMEQGVFLRPLGNIIYILPPYVTSDKQLHQIYEAIETSLSLI
jgi:adenosylmethionine-8-amino-7-oxononanoate aminotransferase